ncbi:protein of unknown function [Lachnospiraceae bacterium]|nr:protein of unknown function [Lachnospiraceae bacterium]
MVKKRTRISDVFPVILFLVFTLSVLCFVVFSVKLYRKVVDQAESVLDTDIAARYMVEKFRSHDELGHIELTEFMGHEAVRLDKEVKNVPYVTYIYVYDGYLRELYTPESDLSLCDEDSGTEILEISEMSAEKLSDNLIKFRFTGAENSTSEAVVSVKSEGE